MESDGMGLEGSVSVSVSASAKQLFTTYVRFVPTETSKVKVTGYHTILDSHLQLQVSFSNIDR